MPVDGVGFTLCRDDDFYCCLSIKCFNVYDTHTGTNNQILRVHMCVGAGVCVCVSAIKYSHHPQRNFENWLSHACGALYYCK